MRLLILLLAFLQAPTITIDAGPDQTVIVQPGVTSFVLAATVRENGNLAPNVKVQWHKISGPGNFTADEDRAITTGHVSAPGTYTLRAVALDYAPAATVTNPPDNSSFSRQVTINGAGIDDTRVVKMEIFIDGKLLASQQNTGLISTVWDLHGNKVKLGPHQVKVMATDNVGQQGSQTITVNKTR